MFDPYSVLGISREASNEDVRSAYHRLIKENHPDTIIDDAEKGAAHEAAIWINEAYKQIVEQRKNTESAAASTSEPRARQGEDIREGFVSSYEERLAKIRSEYESRVARIKAEHLATVEKIDAEYAAGGLRSVGVWHGADPRAMAFEAARRQKITSLREVDAVFREESNRAKSQRDWELHESRPRKYDR